MVRKSSFAVAAVAGLLAACGTAAGTGGAGPARQAQAPHPVVVADRKLAGIGTVLVDRAGKTVYSPQQEADGAIKCTGACLSFWMPVAVAPGTSLRAPSGVTGVLGRIHRADDGLAQLTYNGKPLYTFRLDQAPGQVHGNDFTDHFGGTSFTWHAVTTSGAPGGTGQPGNSPGGYSSQGGASGY